MAQNKLNYRAIGRVGLVISILTVLACFIPFWGGRVFYVAFPVFLIALALSVLGIKQNIRVGLLIGTAALSLIASIVSYGQYSPTVKVQRRLKEAGESALDRYVRSPKTPEIDPEEVRRREEEERKKQAREALLHLRSMATPCSYVAVIPMKGRVWNRHGYGDRGQDPGFSDLYLVGPATLFFGRDFSLGNMKRVIALYSKHSPNAAQFPKYYPGHFNTQATLMLVGMLGKATYVYEDQAIRLKGNRIRHQYDVQSLIVALSLSAEQRRMHKSIRVLEDKISGMNVFQRQEHQALIDSLNLLEARFERSIHRMTNEEIRRIAEKYYYTLETIIVRDTDYDFSRGILRVPVPTILSEHTNNRRIVRRFTVDGYPFTSDMPRSRFFPEVEDPSGRHFNLSMTRDEARSLFSGRDTANLKGRFYYSVSYAGGLASAYEDDTHVGYTVDMKVKVHSVELFRKDGDEPLLDYPMVLYE